MYDATQQTTSSVDDESTLPSQGRIPGTLRLPSDRKVSPPAEGVAAATPPALGPDHREALITRALEQAAVIISLDTAYGRKAEEHGREHVRRMLLVRESFEVDGVLDDESFDVAALDKCGPPEKGRPLNRHQRLAKMCTPRAARANRPLLSKRGYVLSALIKRGIRADQVLEEFGKSERIRGSLRTGMERFVHLHKQDVQEQKKEAPGGDNPFEKWSKKRLAESAHDFLAALFLNDLLAEGVDPDTLLIGEARPPDQRGASRA